MIQEPTKKRRRKAEEDDSAVDKLLGVAKGFLRLNHTIQPKSDTFEEFPWHNHDESHYLPEELVGEVCARLPVKSLLRFRCISKSWDSVISSASFVSHHLTCYHRDDDEPNTPVFAYGFPGRFWLLSPFDPTYCDLISYKEHRFLQQFVLRGQSVDGLFLTCSLSYCAFPKEVHIMLWNPSVRKLHKSPSVYLKGCMYFGLGYSHSSHDCKVVVITPKMENSVRVYTLGNRTWRRMDNYRGDIIKEISSDGTFINGCICWISGGKYMVSFDVNFDEEFNYISLPSKVQSHHYGLAGRSRFYPLQRYPVAYRKLLGLLEFDERCMWNLWVMRNEQGLDSWNKLYTIDLGAVFHPSNCIRCFSNGQMIFPGKNGELMVYDFERNEVGGFLQFQRSLVSSYQSTYQRSLVSSYKESLVLL